jgi:hypothetical protein
MISTKLSNLRKKNLDDIKKDKSINETNIVKYQKGGIIDKKYNLLTIKHTGLGNNLFDICNLYSLSKKHNIEFYVPDLNLLINKLPSYPINLYRNIFLHNDNIIQKYPNVNEYHNINLRISEISKIKSNYMKSINPSNTIYFLSDRYYYINFDKYKNELIKLFEPDEESLTYINNKYGSILNDKTIITISIHIRRGDFKVISDLYNPDYIIKDTYYFNAINYIKNKLFINTNDNLNENNSNENNSNKHIKFIIFSDDIEWCKSKFIGNEFIFIEDNYDYIDFWLMSLCDHNIINKSTFSYLAAYFNYNNSQNKLIIAPYKAFYCEEFVKRKNYTEIKKIHQQVYPKDWIIIKE